MKGHKAHHRGRHHKATGGVNEAAEDLKSKPKRYNNSNVEDEAEERKHGGRAKKHGMSAHGHHAKHHAGRKPRKSGGRAGGSNMNPLSSAHKGTPPKGHTVEMGME